MPGLFCSWRQHETLGYAEDLAHGKDGIMLVTMLEYIRQLSDPWKEPFGLHVVGETSEKTIEDTTG